MVEVKSFGLNPCFALYFVILETCSSGEVTCIIPEKVRQSYCFLGLRRTQPHDRDQKSDSNIATIFFRKIAIVQGPTIFLRALTVSTTCSVLLSGQLDGLPPLLLRHGNVAHAALTRYVTLFTHSGVSQSHPQAHTRQPWRVTSSDPSWEAGERNALWDVRWA